jgi:glycosyltransferase involved in cell wall biosynthesis
MGFRTPGPQWLAACDVLLVPAVGEPFGRTLIEAMLVGTPVVATASGGNIEALRDGAIGILVPPENAGALADGLGLLLERPEWAAALAAAAQKDARSRFGEAMHAAQIMAIYDEMLGRGRTAASASTNAVPAVFGEPAGSQGEVVS